MLLLTASSCFRRTLDVNEIKNLNRVAFEPLQLRPGSETNHLRLDILRQTDETRVNDSTTTTEDEPYYPLGFDLGNGVFYDLRENFSLRVAHLLNFDGNDVFVLKTTSNPAKNKGVAFRSSSGDSLTISYSPKNKIRYQHHRIGPPDSLSFMYKNRLRYSIVRRDSVLVYRDRKKVREGIYRQDDHHYYLVRRRKHVNYQLEGNEVFLQTHYRVTLTDQNRKITIYRRYRRGDRPLRFIEQSHDKIFVYDRRFSGRKFERTGGDLLIYQDKKLTAKYELVRGKRME